MPVSGQMRCDIAIVGAGVCGLWLARHAVRAGLTVALVDAGRAGAGASGGLLGALMPHMPDQWNEKKQFQFEALSTLGAEIALLEADTGLRAGYARVGRIIPLDTPERRALAERRAGDAECNWASGDVAEWNVADQAAFEGWPSAQAMPAGMIHETLAARINPRDLVASLRHFAEASPLVTLAEGHRVVEVANGEARLDDGRPIAAGHTVIAAGHESYAMLGSLLGADAVSFGGAVKGQAALLAADVPSDAPLVYHDGVYLVPHDDGTVAIGSTSEREFAEPFTTDAQLDDLIARARALCPAIAQAPVIARWAGLRPRSFDREPLIGPLPGHAGVHVLTGGFKITLGIAHRMAAALLSQIMDTDDVPIPPRFRAAPRITTKLERLAASAVTPTLSR